MTGWGQDGPMAQAAGHDINYISLSGALHAMGRKGEKPQPPINLVGDFGGGGMFLAFGMACAIIQAQRSGKGQVVDVSMVEGSANLMHMMYSMKAMGVWSEERGTNLLDTGAHFYDTYETKDGKFVAVCAIEKRFFKVLIETLAISEIDLTDQYNEAKWPEHEKILATLFRSKSRDDWSGIFEGTDACFAPVLSLNEAPEHPHSQARNSYVSVDGIQQPAPAPRFSRTKSEIQNSPTEVGEFDQQILADWGLTDAEIATYLQAGSAA